MTSTLAPSVQMKGEAEIEIDGTQLLQSAPAAESTILHALISAQKRYNLFSPQTPVVIAVSGGADSICLLHGLYRLAPFWRISLHVAHLDHALRPDSSEDASFVAALANQLHLPFYIERLSPGVLDDDSRGLEGAARSARYCFLRNVAAQLQPPATVATAHHQDDQAETLLLHLVQGSGLQGLAGMAWVTTLPDDQEPPVRLVRPLLAVDRATIQAYLGSVGLAWREDSTNRDLAHPRNQLRHQILPLLATINPNIHATLARTADLLAAEAEHAAHRDQSTLAAITLTDTQGKGGEDTQETRLLLNLFQLSQFDLATRRGVLRQALLRLGIDLRVVGMEGIETLLYQLTAQSPNASGPHPLVKDWEWTIVRLDDAFYLSLHRAGVLPQSVDHPHFQKPLAKPLPISQEGTLIHPSLIGEWRLQSSLLMTSALPDGWRAGRQSWSLLCDAERCGELFLTTFHAGMRIAPLGMAGHQRAVGDIFTDCKIPPYLRVGWPVVTNEEGTIIWLCGLVVADSVRVQPFTKQVQRLLWQRGNSGQAGWQPL